MLILQDQNPAQTTIDYQGQNVEDPGSWPNHRQPSSAAKPRLVADRFPVGSQPRLYQITPRSQNNLNARVSAIDIERLSLVDITRLCLKNERIRPVISQGFFTEITLVGVQRAKKAMFLRFCSAECQTDRWPVIAKPKAKAPTKCGHSC